MNFGGKISTFIYRKLMQFCDWLDRQGDDFGRFF